MIAKQVCAGIAAVVAGCVFGMASAKLPALTDEQKAKAAEAKAKSDEAAKKEAELLGKYQDRAVERYKGKGAVMKTGATAVKK